MSSVLCSGRFLAIHEKHHVTTTTHLCSYNVVCCSFLLLLRWLTDDDEDYVEIDEMQQRLAQMKRNNRGKGMLVFCG